MGSTNRQLWEGFTRGCGIGAGFLFVVALGGLFAQAIQTFQAGDLISAASINENFSFLRARIESPLPFVTSGSSGSWTTTSTAWTNVPNLSVTITTGGSPVWLGLIADGNGQSLLSAYDNTWYLPRGDIRILRDGTEIAQYLIAMRAGGPPESYQYVHVPVGAVWHVDNPGPGTYTYTVQAASEGATADASVGVINAKLFAARFNEL